MEFYKTIPDNLGFTKLFFQPKETEPQMFTVVYNDVFETLFQEISEIPEYEEQRMGNLITNISVNSYSYFSEEVKENVIRNFFIQFFVIAYELSKFIGSKPARKLLYPNFIPQIIQIMQRYGFMRSDLDDQELLILETNIHTVMFYATVLLED